MTFNHKLLPVTEELFGTGAKWWKQVVRITEERSLPETEEDRLCAQGSGGYLAARADGMGSYPLQRGLFLFSPTLGIPAEFHYRFLSRLPIKVHTRGIFTRGLDAAPSDFK